MLQWHKVRNAKKLYVSILFLSYSVLQQAASLQIVTFYFIVGSE